jgi:glucose/arabinose dehydrogenase
MTSQRGAATAVLVVGVLLGGCFTSTVFEAAQPGVPQARAPGNTGDTIFTTRCAGCHGTDASGGGRGPSLFDAARFSRLSDAGIRERIANGVKDSEMPAFAGSLSNQQIDAVIAYLRERTTRLAIQPGQTPGAPAAQGVTRLPPNPDGQRIHTPLHDVLVESVVRDLDTPYGLDFLPDGRLLVSERAPVGHLRIIDPSGQRPPVRVSGLPATHQGQDAGMLDVAAGPDHARDGWIYLAFSDSDPSRPVPPSAPPGAPDGRAPRAPSMTVVVRGRIDTANRWVDQQELFRAPWTVYTSSTAHYGARIVFDGRGHLFFSIGERGDMSQAQDLGSPLGKIHRVALDGSVPRDNPFVRTPGALPTIWSYGHRNPEGLAFDPATGLLWESEHGPTGGDEVNLIERGGNYGWGIVSKGMQPGLKGVSAPGMIDPAAWYFPTIAPSGIAFYTGKAYEGWRGSLLLAALRGQELRRLTVKGRTVVSQEVLFSGLGRVRDVATGPDGLLYVLVTDPTGPGWNINFTDPVRGQLLRLRPLQWQQVDMRFQ